MRLSSSLFFVLGLVAMQSFSSPLNAHGVRHQIKQTQATVVTFTYDNGQPLAGAHFEAGPLASDQQGGTQGQTDEQGRAVILTDTPGRWRLRAFARDGHGAVVEFDVGTSSDTEGMPTPAPARAASFPRWVGFVVLAATFVVLRQGVRRRQKKGAV